MTTPTSPRAASTASLYAPHGEPGAFFNPWGRSDRTLLDLLRWKLLSRNPYGRHGSPVVPRAANDGAALAGAFVVLSHNHYDHLDTWTVERLPPETDFYVPLGLAAWFRRHAADLGGVERLRILAVGQRWECPPPA